MQVICTKGCGSIVIVLQLRIAILNHRADLRVRLRFAAVGCSVNCKDMQVARSSMWPIFKILINPLRNVSTYLVWIHHGRELAKSKVEMSKNMVSTNNGGVLGGQATLFPK